MAAPKERLHQRGENTDHSRRKNSLKWVEDVFPPTFSFTAREMFAKDQTPVADQGHDGREKRTSVSVYDMIARRISPLDTSSIKNVYERVWLMCAIEEEETRRRHQEQEEGKNHVGKRSETVEAASQGAQLLTEEHRKPEGTRKSHQGVDIEDSTLWDSSEIEILRGVFQAARAENIHLKAQMRSNQEHVKKMDRKCKKQSDALETKTHKLKEARKANERLHILSTNLRQQLDVANATIEFLHQEIKGLRETQADLMKQGHGLRLELDQERIERKNTEVDLVSQQRSAIRQVELHEEKLKQLHSAEKERLLGQITQLTKDLEGEKSRHQRSLRGLQHLRNHFSSVPLEGITKKAHVVNIDQLEKLTL